MVGNRREFERLADGTTQQQQVQQVYREIRKVNSGAINTSGSSLFCFYFRMPE